MNNTTIVPYRYAGYHEYISNTANGSSNGLYIVRASQNYRTTGEKMTVVLVLYKNVGGWGNPGAGWGTMSGSDGAPWVV